MTKNKFQKQEEKKVKYAPKKVFVLENGNYKEITYSEFKTLEQADKEYANKYFLPLHGMLMEVTEEEYKAYYKDKRRQKYIDERSKANGDISYNSFDTDELLGEDILVDKHTDVEAQVISKMTVQQLRQAFHLLSPDEIELLKLRYFKEYSEIKLSKFYGVSQQAIKKSLQ